MAEQNDWKKWSLRIPLLLFLFGATAGIYQSFPSLFIHENGFLAGAQYIGGIAVLFLMFEKIGLNQKKTHFTIGILLILIGLLLDQLFV